MADFGSGAGNIQRQPRTTGNFIKQRRSQRLMETGNSLMVQWLGLWVFTAENTGSIPGRGSKILQAMCQGKKIRLMETYQKDIGIWETLSLQKNNNYNQSNHTELYNQRLVTQSCLTLCPPVDYSLPGSSVHGIFQARILVWIAIPFSRGSSQPRDHTRVSCVAGLFFTIWATGEAPCNLGATKILKK